MAETAAPGNSHRTGIVEKLAAPILDIRKFVDRGGTTRGHNLEEAASNYADAVHVGVIFIESLVLP